MWPNVLFDRVLSQLLCHFFYYCGGVGATNSDCDTVLYMSNSKTDTEGRAEVLRGLTQVQPRASHVVSISSVRRRCKRPAYYSVLVLHQHDGRDYDTGEELRFAAEFHRCRLYVHCQWLYSTLWSAEVIIVPRHIIWSWYTGRRWWVGCYIWYSEEGTWRVRCSAILMCQ